MGAVRITHRSMSTPRVTALTRCYCTCEILLSKLDDRENHGVCQLLGQLCVETIELKAKGLS